jgi:hypothetical protein
VLGLERLLLITFLGASKKSDRPPGPHPGLVDQRKAIPGLPKRDQQAKPQSEEKANPFQLS